MRLQQPNKIVVSAHTHKCSWCECWDVATQVNNTSLEEYTYLVTSYIRKCVVDVVMMMTMMWCGDHIGILHSTPKARLKLVSRGQRGDCRGKYHKRGRCLARAGSHVQRLCPCDSGPGFKCIYSKHFFGLWAFFSYITKATKVLLPVEHILCHLGFDLHNTDSARKPTLPQGDLLLSVTTVDGEKKPATKIITSKASWSYYWRF